MDRLKNILLAVLSVLVVWIYIDRYVFSQKCGSTSDPVSDTLPQLQSPRIAYVNIDTILLQYEQALEYNNAFGSKRQKSEAEYAQKARALEKEFMEFQDKAQRGGFLSQTSMKAQQETLLQKKDELERLEARLTNELMQEQQRLNEELFNTIVSFIHNYNKSAGYDLILTNTGNGTILYGTPAMNITGEIVEGLNREYKEKK